MKPYSTDQQINYLTQESTRSRQTIHCRSSEPMYSKGYESEGKGAPAGQIRPAQLERWMRKYYFETRIDIGSSGVESFTFGELRELIGLHEQDLDHILFDDSRTQGGSGLLEAIAKQFADGNSQRVMATHGSSEAIFMVMHALLRAGDEVVVLDPCYQQLYSIAESIGCQLKPWRLRFERQFIPDLDEARQIITSRTRMVVVNFPHNPTGVTVSVEQQKELISIAAESGAYLVWDAAFAQLTYDRPPLLEPGRWYDKSVTLGTLSKASGLPGLRVGWLIAQPEVIEHCIHLRDYLTLHLSPMIEFIAQRAIENTDKLVAARSNQARVNREIVAEWVNRQKEKVEWVCPESGVCAFPRLNSAANVEELCHRLAQQYGVLLVPGYCFNYPSHVRLGFGGPTDDLVEGLSILSGLL
jgi:capreomycidine synthase